MKIDRISNSDPVTTTSRATLWTQRQLQLCSLAQSFANSHKQISLLLPRLALYYARLFEVTRQWHVRRSGNVLLVDIGHQSAGSQFDVAHALATITQPSSNAMFAIRIGSFCVENFRSDGQILSIPARYQSTVAMLVGNAGQSTNTAYSHPGRYVCLHLVF
jgi:hypothetical protein